MEVDFSSIATKFEVQEAVIQRLHELIPFQDSFDFTIAAEDEVDFWGRIDNLPVTITMELHSLQVGIPNTDKDFPQDSLSPYLQNFWAANCLNNNIVPTTNNSVAFSRIYSDDLVTLFDPFLNWKLVDDLYIYENYKFSVKNLIYMCDAYSANGFPWLFCDIDFLRTAYMQMHALSQTIPSKYSYLAEEIGTKITQLQYPSKESFSKDIIQCEMNTDDIDEFEVPEEMLSDISTILGKSNELIKLTQKVPPIGPIDDWTLSRTAALVGQMGLPLQQRSAFVLTPQILQARIGHDVESPYEPNSITELLFSNAQGQTMPMPYAHTTSELPNGSNLPFIRSVLKRYVSKQLISLGYASSSDVALDILTDTIHYEIKCIGQHAATINSDSSNPLQTINNALYMQGYDINQLNSSVSNT